MSPQKPDTIKVRGVALSQEFDSMVEEVRESLGMNRSAFIKHCILHFLETQKFVENRLVGKRPWKRRLCRNDARAPYGSKNGEAKSSERIIEDEQSKREAEGKGSNPGR